MESYLPLLHFMLLPNGTCHHILTTPYWSCAWPTLLSGTCPLKAFEFITLGLYLLAPYQGICSNCNLLPFLFRLYDLYSFQVIPVLGEVIAGDWKSYQYLVESIRQFPSQVQNLYFTTKALELKSMYIFAISLCFRRNSER